MKTLEDRFWEKVIKTDTCWLWTGSKTKQELGQGYGQIRIDGKTRVAHAVSYVWARGPIPGGLDLDHLCRVRLCVNPDHLEAVEPIVNLLRGEGALAKKARQTHCGKGHPLIGDNLAIVNNGRSRRCVQCKRDNQNAANALKRSLL